MLSSLYIFYSFVAFGFLLASIHYESAIFSSLSGILFGMLGFASFKIEVISNATTLIFYYSYLGYLNSGLFLVCIILTVYYAFTGRESFGAITGGDNVG